MNKLKVSEILKLHIINKIFYIEDKNNIEIDCESFWVAIRETKKIDIIKNQACFDIFDIRDELLFQLKSLSDFEKKQVESDWDFFFEARFEINNNGEIFVVDKNYSLISHSQRFILLLLIQNIKKADKYKLVFLSNEISDYIKYQIIEFFTDSHFIFFSNDLNWLYSSDLYYPFQKDNISKTKPVLYVEGDLDYFTFSLFYKEDKIKHGYTSSQIIDIAKRQKGYNKYYIDRDGYTINALRILEKYNLQVNCYSEIENFWISPDILPVWLEDLHFSQKDIMNVIHRSNDNILERASANFSTTFTRFKNRQAYIEKSGLPFLSEKEIDREYHKRKLDLKHKNIPQILTWFDNKNLFNHLLKEIGFDNINKWKKKINQNHEKTNKINITKYFKREEI